MTTIFISYRRQDSAAWTGRLFDVLSGRYGPDKVFLDFAIQPGEMWKANIDEEVSQADAVLAVIGPGWLDAAYRDGRRRIDDPGDLMRHELRVALYMHKLLVPILVGGAQMPRAALLPADIASLANLQAISIGDATWTDDVSRLTTLLDDKGNSRWTRWLPWKK